MRVTLAPDPVAFALFAGNRYALPALPAAAKVPPTYWVEGGVIGGVALGGLGAAVGYAFCGLGDSAANCNHEALGLGLVGATVGFITGALIGGQFPKHE